MSATTTAPVTAPTRLTSTGTALATAIAAVDSSSGADGIARGTLAEVTRAAFVEYAERYVRVGVLPVNLKGEVTGRIWLAACETLKPVPAAERTPGETSLGQYMSRLVKVATTVGYGMAAVESVESMNEAYKALTGESAEATKAAADRAFIAWLSGQSPETQKAFKLVKRALHTDGGSDHTVAAFRDFGNAPTGI